MPPPPKPPPEAPGGLVLQLLRKTPLPATNLPRDLSQCRPSMCSTCRQLGEAGLAAPASAAVSSVLFSNSAF